LVESEVITESIELEEELKIDSLEITEAEIVESIADTIQANTGSTIEATEANAQIKLPPYIIKEDEFGNSARYIQGESG